MPDLVSKILALHKVLDEAALPHAFGGALALAWCTERARGTIDIDINIFVPADQTAAVLSALPKDVKVTRKDVAIFRRDGQVRVWWEKTPLDLFLNSSAYHDDIVTRIRWEEFAGAVIPFLSCYDLAVFKVFFNRTKDWADLEAMRDVGSLDIERVQAAIIHYLGADDERMARLAQLARS